MGGELKIFACHFVQLPCNHCQARFTSILLYPLSITSRVVYSTEEIRVEEEFLCSLSWSVHHNLARDVYIESTCGFVQAGF